MSPHHEVHLHLEPGNDPAPIAGYAVDTHGNTRAFASWVALIELLQEVRTHARIAAITVASESACEPLT